MVLAGFWSSENDDALVARATSELRRLSQTDWKLIEVENGVVSFDQLYCRIETGERAGARRYRETGERAGARRYRGIVATVVEASISGLNGDVDICCELASEALNLSRDAFGRLPLFWYQQGALTWFSTRLQCLVKLIDNPVVNEQAFYGYACFSYVPNPVSAIEGVNSLTAGCELAIGKDSKPLVVRRSEWRCTSNVITDETSAVEQIKNRLKEATLLQTADCKKERVAVFLSGGLDSAITAALLRQAGVNVTAYSLDFGDYGLSELPHAKEVADFLKIPLTVVPASPSKIKAGLKKTLQALDQPFGDGVTVPLYLLMEAASRAGHKIAFNGEGGDQLFGGWTNKPIIAAGVYSEQQTGSEFLDHYLRTFHKCFGYERVLLANNLSHRMSSNNLVDFLSEPLSDHATNSVLHRLRRANLMLKGPQNIQPRASNLAIANGLQLRSLFCDRDLAELSFQLHPNLLLNAACEKYVLKRGADDLLPESIVWREKRGMGVPLTEWCHGPLWGLIGKYLRPARLKNSMYWHPDVALNVALGEAGAQIAGRRCGEFLWQILVWEYWHQLMFPLRSRAPSYNVLWPPLTFWKLLRAEPTLQ